MSSLEFLKIVKIIFNLNNLKELINYIYALNRMANKNFIIIFPTAY